MALGGDGRDPLEPEQIITTDGDHDDNDGDSINEPPLHPVTAMQDAFEESINDAADGPEQEDSKNKPVPDAQARRKLLLEADTYDDSLRARWKLSANTKSHPLVKLMAQIIFGLHLLHQQQAKSDAEVVKILQTHVDEIDGFLERTTEDYDSALRDIQERIGFLKLPMTHVEVFDVMLDDRKFRKQLLDGNQKIQVIIDRTTKAAAAATSDVNTGQTATVQLAQYLDQIQPTWPQNTSEQAAILLAMRGNQEGWLGCMRDLTVKASVLCNAVDQLSAVIADMSRLAAAASRRNLVSAAFVLPASIADRSCQAKPRTPTLDKAAAVSRYSPEPGHVRTRSPHARNLSLPEANKPLPNEPRNTGNTTYTDKPSGQVVPGEPNTRRQYGQPLFSNVPDKARPRPNMEPRQARSPVASMTKDLAGFFKSTSPSNHPLPDHSRPQHTRQPTEWSAIQNQFIDSRETHDVTQPMSRNDAASRGAAVDYHYEMQRQAAHNQQPSPQPSPRIPVTSPPQDSPSAWSPNKAHVRLGLNQQGPFASALQSPGYTMGMRSPGVVSAHTPTNGYFGSEASRDKGTASPVVAIKKLFNRKKAQALYI